MANELKVAITADNSSALASLTQFSGAVKAASGQIEGHFDGVAKAVQNMAAPLMQITAMLGGGALFKGAIDGAVTLAKEVGGLQRLMGGTIEQASVTRVAIKSVFGDVDGWDAASAKLVKTLNKDEESIKSLGVATRDSKGHFRDMTALMPEVVQKLAEYKQGTDRDAAAQDIFGKSFADVLKYASMTPAVMDAAREHARAFGLELSGQDQATIKAYRRSLVTLDEAFEGLKTRVAVEVMPRLTSLANHLSTAAPAAINATVTALQTAQELLSNTAVQVGLGAIAIQSILPLLTSLAAKIPMITLAMTAWRTSMYISAATGVTGLTAVAAAAKSTGAALLGMLNPWVLAGIAVTAVAAGLVWFAKASERAAEASRKAVEAAQANTKSWRDYANEVKALESELTNSNTTHTRKIQIQERLTEITTALVRIYPEFADQLKTEAGLNKSLTASIEAKTKARISDLEMLLLQSRMQAQNYRDEITQREQWNKHGKSQITPGNSLKNDAITKEISYNEKKLDEVKGLLATLKNTSSPELYAELQGLKAKIEEDKGDKRWAGSAAGGTKDVELSGSEKALRLDKARLEIMADATLDQQQAKEIAKANIELEEKRIQLSKDAQSGRMTMAEAQNEYNILKEVNSKKIELIQTQYLDKRKDLEASLQGQLVTIEEGGLEAKLAAIRKTFDRIREENAKLGSNALPEEQIKQAEDAAKAQAQIEQTKADLAAIKKELAELAQINGGAITDQQRDEVLNRYSKKGKGPAVQQYKQENHIGESGKKGSLDAINAEIEKNKNKWQTWNNFTCGQINSVKSSVSTLFTSIVQSGQTGSQKWHALWMSISSSAIKALSDIAAQELITWGIQKAKALWQSVNGKKEIAETAAVTAAKVTGSATATAANTAQVTSDGAATAASTTKAASGFFAAYSGIPWVGLALAIAGIVAMQAVMSKITAHARGGVIDQPTLALMGEVPGSTEIVANERDFKSWAAQTSNAGVNLGLNLAAQQARVADLHHKASDYGRQGLEAGNGSYRGGYHDYRGAMIVTTSSREWADAVNRGVQTYGRSRG